MEIKYKRILETLLGSGKLNDFETTAFQNMNDRDEQYQGNSTLSIKQKSWIDKKKLELIDGITDKKELAERLEPSMEYENCKVVLVSGEGFRIEANGVTLSVPVTKGEGVIIASYLSKALPEIGGLESPAETEQTAEEVAADVEAVMDGTEPEYVVEPNDPF